MSTAGSQVTGPRPIENAGKTGRRKRRISEVLPEMRNRIQPLFARGVPIERIAEDLDVSPLQLLEHVVREYAGARHPGPFTVASKPMAAGLSAREGLRLMRRPA